MKNTFGTPLLLIIFLVLVAGQSSEAREGGHFIEASKLPKIVVAAGGKVTLFVDWDNIKEIKRKIATTPWHSTMMYTINRTNQPITIRRTTCFDSNSVIEYQNKDKKWQRTRPKFIRWGACGNGMWTNTFQLLPGKCFVEPVVLQKIGKMETVRFRLVADGKNYYSNSHRLQVCINPHSANATKEDDWAVAYGTTDLLRKLINGKIKFARPRNPVNGGGAPQAKLLAIRTLAKPWHVPSESIPILDAVIKAGDKHYAPQALAVKKQINQRKSKAKKSK